MGFIKKKKVEEPPVQVSTQEAGVGDVEEEGVEEKGVPLPPHITQLLEALKPYSQVYATPPPMTTAQNDEILMILLGIFGELREMNQELKRLNEFVDKE